MPCTEEVESNERLPPAWSKAKPCFMAPHQPMWKKCSWGRFYTKFAAISMAPNPKKKTDREPSILPRFAKICHRIFPNGTKWSKTKTKCAKKIRCKVVGFTKVPPILRYFDEAMAFHLKPTAEALLLSREPRHQFHGEVLLRHD